MGRRGGNQRLTHGVEIDEPAHFHPSSDGVQHARHHGQDKSRALTMVWRRASINMEEVNTDSTNTRDLKAACERIGTRAAAGRDSRVWGGEGEEGAFISVAGSGQRHHCGRNRGNTNQQKPGAVEEE